MELHMEHNGKIYLAYVKVDSKWYYFKLWMYNDLYTFPYLVAFQKFSCCLECRLRHYKAFKRNLFENNGLGSQLMDIEKKRMIDQSINKPER